MEKVRDSLRKLLPVITASTLSCFPLLGLGRQDTHTHTETIHSKMNTVTLEHTPEEIFYILVK